MNTEPQPSARGVEVNEDLQCSCEDTVRQKGCRGHEVNALDARTSEFEALLV